MPWATPPPIWPSTELRIDRLAHVVGRNDPAYAHHPQVQIDLDLGHLRPEGVGGIGRALAVPVEGRRRRIEISLADQDVAPLVRRERAKIEAPWRAASAHEDLAVAELDPRVIAGIGPAQELGPQILAGKLRRLARDEGLPRGRGLAGIRGQRRVAHDDLEASGRHTQRLGVSADLDHYRVGALTHVDRAIVECEFAVAVDADAHCGRVGQGGVAAAVPHGRRTADAAPEWIPARPPPVERLGLTSRPAPTRFQGVEGLREPGARRRPAPDRFRSSSVRSAFRSRNSRRRGRSFSARSS